MGTQTKHPEAVETPVAVVFQNTSSPGQAIFCKEGEYWAIGYGRRSFRLKDTKGLGYLAHLLRHPGVEIHVLDLRPDRSKPLTGFPGYSGTDGTAASAEAPLSFPKRCGG